MVWNAPGMHLNEVPRWARPLLRLALDLSAYVAVRDEPSRATLAQYADHDRITVVPDTGFGVAQLLPAEASPELQRLWKAAGITAPYVLVQAAESMSWFPQFVSANERPLSGLQFVALPIGPVLGDDADNLRGFVGLPTWPDPLLLAELISHASAVVGHSYHLAVTALTCGVPVFTWADLTVGKFTALREFETIYPLSAVKEAGGSGSCRASENANPCRRWIRTCVFSPIIGIAPPKPYATDRMRRQEPLSEGSGSPCRFFSKNRPPRSCT